MEKLLIVDGSNLLFQMFYGMPARILGASGRPVQGTLGFVGALLKIIRMVEPTHLAVVFDGECKNQRKDLDENYKANRPDYSNLPEEEIPFSQLPDIYDALDLIGICHKQTSNCEADDWIAGYARQLGDTIPMVISSQDSDFFQLISPKIQILRYRGKNTALWDSVCVREKLGIRPDQYGDFKSLVGDTADNIKGAPRIGPKTAAQLLNQFDTLDEILQNIPAVKKPSIRASLSENAERLRLNQRLICLSGDTDLPFTLEQLRWPGTNLTTMEVLKIIGVF